MLDVSGLHAVELRIHAVDDVIQMISRIYVVIRIGRAERRVVDVIDGGAQLLVKEPA